MLLTSKVFFYSGVLAFGIYNTTVINWELNKEGSRVCPKCAYTRMALGMGMSAIAGLMLYQELSTEFQTHKLLNTQVNP